MRDCACLTVRVCAQASGGGADPHRGRPEQTEEPGRPRHRVRRLGLFHLVSARTDLLVRVSGKVSLGYTGRVMYWDGLVHCFTLSLLGQIYW